MEIPVEEISPEARLLLIEMAEGLAEGLRKNTIRFSEGNARALSRWAERVLHPEKGKVEETAWRNCTQICDYIGFTPQTFRSYVRKGKIPAGRKLREYSVPVWDKKEIDSFAEWYFSHKRKRKRD